jgi:uncharacterized protein YecE (DUF72 family)
VSTPPSFRFAVKLPRAITHDAKLRRARVPLEVFLEQAGGLGAKLGPLLVQLPPSLEFNARVARSFFATLRARHAGALVCEPRHPTWFEARATDLLVDHRVGRVATDPSRIPEALHPGGWLRGTRRERAVVYYRLHGSPRKYWSRYPIERLRAWADDLVRHAESADVWCIFDNTAIGSAIENALEMSTLLRQQRRAPAEEGPDGSQSACAVSGVGRRLGGISDPMTTMGVDTRSHFATVNGHPQSQHSPRTKSHVWLARRVTLPATSRNSAARWPSRNASCPVRRYPAVTTGPATATGASAYSARNPVCSLAPSHQIGSNPAAQAANTNSAAKIRRRVGSRAS